MTLAEPTRTQEERYLSLFSLFENTLHVAQTIRGFQKREAAEAMILFANSILAGESNE